MKPRTAALIAIAVLCPLLVAADFVLPEFDHGFVQDFAQVLSANDAKTLSKKLDDFHAQTKNSFVVVIVPSLNGLTVEDFSIRLAEKWKVGKKGADNGLVYLVAPNEHKARMEVGYGLEGKLPDGKCGRLIRVAGPFYKQKQWFQGIDAVVSGVIAEFAAAAAAAPIAATPPESSTAGFVVIGIIVLVVVIMIVGAIMSNREKESGERYVSSGSGGGYVPPPFIPYVPSSPRRKRDEEEEEESPRRSSSSDDDDSSSGSNSSSEESDSGGGFGGGGASDSW